MKKSLLITSFLFYALSAVYAGSGTKESPYSVAEAMARNNDNKSYYVRGYVVGEMDNYSNNKFFYNVAPPFGGTTAYLMADQKWEVDLSRCMTVQMAGEWAAAFSLVAHPEYWGKEILLKGSLKKYIELPGIKSVTDCEIVTPLPLADETTTWNFFETFDKKEAYTPNNPDRLYAGGIYKDETCEWIFDGSSWGDTGNDAKWGRAAAHLRMTESTSGEPGSIYMNEDLPNGIGFVRFWAAYYDTDKGGKLSLSISPDGGKNWELIASDIVIQKNLKEYQYKIDRIGKWRVKIFKSDGTAAGVNVDNIHISDYTQLSSLDKTESGMLRVSSGVGYIRVIQEGSESLLKLFSVSGALVRNYPLSTGENVIQMPAGVYFFKSISDSGKIIVY